MVELADRDRRGRPRVVVTGMGAMTPIGKTLDEYWQNLREGRSGAGIATLMDVTDIPAKVVAEVKNFDPTDYMDAAVAQRLPRFTQLAVAATGQAMAHADLELEAEDPSRVGCELGTGMTGFREFAVEMERWFAGRDGQSLALTPEIAMTPASAQLARYFRFAGPSNSDSTACAASTQALGNAMRILQRGDADVMLAGGSEANFSRFAIAAFHALRALSTYTEDPTRASRPFDRLRDGFVGGEGAGMLVLETLEHARRRKARIYAELVGFAVTHDAFHVVMPTEHAAAQARAMTLAIHDAGLSTDEIDYINAHGTSTPLNDRAETIAIKRAFGERAYRIPISSTKSMIGHLISAAGAVEAIATILSMEHQAAHPTINLEHPDPDCDLDYVPNQARPMRLDLALSNSFGFGGQNACLLIQRFPD